MSTSLVWFDPGVVRNGAGEPYKVSTPFSKAWAAHLLAYDEQRDVPGAQPADGRHRGRRPGHRPPFDAWREGRTGYPIVDHAEERAEALRRYDVVRGR